MACRLLFLPNTSRIKLHSISIACAQFVHSVQIAKCRNIKLLCAKVVAYVTNLCKLSLPVDCSRGITPPARTAGLAFLLFQCSGRRRLAAFGFLVAFFPRVEQRAALILLTFGIVAVHPPFHTRLVRARQMHACLIRPLLGARVARFPVDNLLAAPECVLAAVMMR